MEIVDFLLTPFHVVWGVWCVVVWYGVVCCSVAYCGVVRGGMVCCSVVYCGVVWCAVVDSWWRINGSWYWLMIYRRC